MSNTQLHCLPASVVCDLVPHRTARPKSVVDGLFLPSNGVILFVGLVSEGSVVITQSQVLLLPSQAVHHTAGGDRLSPAPLLSSLLAWLPKTQRPRSAQWRVQRFETKGNGPSKSGESYVTSRTLQVRAFASIAEQ